MYSQVDLTIEVQTTEAEDIDFKRNNVLIKKPKINALEILYDYFIKEKHGNPLPFKTSDKITLLLELIGGSGGIYAWPSAMQYARNMNDWLYYSIVVTNPLSNTLFLMKATDNLFETIELESQIPEALKDIIKKPPTKDLAIKYSKMLVGSVVCVIPFGIAVYLFPLPNCTEPWCLGLSISHSVVTNTILHAISWNLILSKEFWYYRLPIIPLEKLYTFIKNCCQDEELVELQKLLEEQEDIYAVYRKTLSQTFCSATDWIVSGSLKGERRPNLALRTIQRDEMSFLQFLSYAPATPPTPEYSFLGSIFSNVNSLLSRGGIGFLGAGLMCVGCIGWIANPYYVGQLEKLSLPVNIVAGSLPAYSTAVLCAFYGAHVFNQIYQYLTNWPSFQDKFSYEAQMYPFTFSVFLLLNIYISFFSYATATELINTVFQDEMWDEVRPVLSWMAMPTLQLLSFIPLLDLFSLIIRKTVAKFGISENDETLAARLLLKTSYIPHYLQQMKGEELFDSVLQMSSQQQKFLGLIPKHIKRDKMILEEKQQRITEIRNSFFYSTPEMREQSAPILTSPSSVGISESEEPNLSRYQSY